MPKNYQVRYVTKKMTRNGKAMQIVTLSEISEDGEILKPIRAFQFENLIDFNRTKVYQFILGLTSKGQHVITDVLTKPKPQA